MTMHLPARVTPAAGESLDSWLDRTADHNGIPRRIFRRITKGLDANHLARLLSSDPDTVRSAVVDERFGRLLRRRNPWMVGVQWGCPICASAGRPRMLAWQMAFHPVCQRCRCYLASSPHCSPVAAHPRMLEHAATLLAAFQSGNEYTISKLHSVVALTADTADEEWPARIIPVPARPPVAFRNWGRHIPADPLVTANLLSMTADPENNRLLADEGWRRLPPELLVGRLEGPWWYPDHPRSDFGRRWSNRNVAQLAAFRREVRQLSLAHGLEPRHIPRLLLLPGELPLPNRDWLDERVCAAAMLTHLIDSAGGSTRAEPDLEAPAQGHFNAFMLNLGISRTHTLLIRRGVQHLISDGLVDYQLRREVLNSREARRGIRRLTGRLASSVRSPGTPVHEVAADWLRLTLAGDELGSWTEAILDWERRTDPEILLALVEFAAHLFSLTETDVRFEQATAAAARFAE